MSFSVSQVPGLTSDPFHDASTINSNVLSANKSNPATVNYNIQRSEIQRRRAARNSMLNRPMGNSYIGSFPFFGGSNANNQSLINKKDSVVTDLSHLPLSTSSPIDLAQQCVNAQIEKDNSTPTLYEVFSAYVVDNYNFNPNQTKNPFSRFEKVSFFSIPEKLLDKNSDSLVTNMGVFPEIQRAWLSLDSKLYIWNYNASLTDQEFDTIDDFEGTILKCALVRPKKDVFVESVNYLIIVATSKEMKILALEYSPDSKKLEVSDTKMSVSVHGLIVNQIVCLEYTNDIFFSGAGSSDCVWKLNYSNTHDWFSKNISKEQVTNSSFSSSLSGIPILNWLNDSTSSKTEFVVDLKIDQSRKILYTLSSNSIIKAYKLQFKNGKVVLGQPLIKRISHLLKELSTTSINIRSSLLRSNLKLINIFPVTDKENTSLFLTAVASNGVRFYLNGSTLYGDRLTLTTNFVKFPPIDLKLYETIEKRKEKMISQNQNIDEAQIMPAPQMHNNRSSFYSRSSQKSGVNADPYFPSTYQNNLNINNRDNDKSITKSFAAPLISIEELKDAQEKSLLLHNTSHTLIISPGIFIGFSKDLGLYTSTPDYGVLKKSSQYVEDFEIFEKYSEVFDIVQLTSSFKTTNSPKGYANEFASQYTDEPLEFAVLTNNGIVVYRYRTPDLILEDSMNDSVFKQFASKYGYDEACSTMLFLACKYDKSETFRNIATKYFITGGQNSKLDKALSPVIDNVEPSDRFFAVLILFSRLIRGIWNKEVFKLRPEVKFDKFGYVDTKSLNTIKTDKHILLESLNIKKQELEYLLCSILIIIKFFEENRNIIPGLSKDINSQGENTSWKGKATEVCVQAEQICFDSISKFLNIVKEGLSFLTILLEETESESLTSHENFKSIISFLPIQAQVDLSCITFSDFFAKSDINVSRLIKDLLSCIINKSISQGNSVELVSNTLQEKCGYFCSTGDVLIFKAVESLKKAKDYSDAKDDQLKLKYLENAVTLLKQTSDSLSDEMIANCVNTILELGYYPNAVKFLLDIANTPELVKLSTQYQKDVQLSMVTDPLKKNSYQRKLKLFHIIFQILVDIDKKALSSVEQAAESTLIGSSTNNTGKFKDFQSVFVDREGNLTTYYSKLRDECYKICLEVQDKMFHFEFYKWFVINGVGEKLLYIDTPYILEFLQSQATNDLEMSKLLWVYYSKKGNYYEAASHLYYLSLSTFDITLEDRIHFLSVANSFIQVIETQYLHQDVMVLASQISDLISVSNLQDELLSTIMNDSRISDLAKSVAKEELNGEILTVNDLYNKYIDPLGYYELSLLCFKISDHRNLEDILGKWESLFDKWYVEYSQKPDCSNTPFYAEVVNKFSAIADRLSDVESLFPIDQLINIMLKSIQKHSDSSIAIPTGVIVDAFIKSGVAFNRLYYSMRKLIEGSTYELFEGYNKLLNSEMVYLIKTWFKSDKKLRELISSDEIVNMTEYDHETDPIYKFTKTTGSAL